MNGAFKGVVRMVTWWPRKAKTLARLICGIMCPGAGNGRM